MGNVRHGHTQAERVFVRELGHMTTRDLSWPSLTARPVIPDPPRRPDVRVIALRADWLHGGEPAVPGEAYALDAALAAHLVAQGRARFA